MSANNNAEAHANPHQMMITVTVMIGALMAIIDTSIVNVSLPEIGASLGATVDELSMTATGYIIAEAIIMPLTGWLTVTMGRRKFYVTALSIFTLASLACGMAWNIEALSVFRIIQGLGGGVLIPTAQAIMLENAGPGQRGKAMSLFGLGVMVGPALGPVIGGWLTTNASWHWIFTVNVPIGILAIFLAMMYLQTPPDINRAQGRFDTLGLSTLIIGIASMQFVLERGQRNDWFESGLITTLAITALIAIPVFIIHELRTEHPIVDLTVLKDRNFLLGNIIGIIMGFGLYGIILILPLFMSNILGYDSWHTAMALFPGAIATGFAMPIAGFLADRLDARISMSIGLIITAMGMFGFAHLNANAGYSDLLMPQILRGFGMGLVFVPLSTIAMSSLPRNHLAGAAGLYTLIRQLGGSIGIAMLTTMLTRRQVLHMSRLAEHISLYSAPAVERLNQLQGSFIAQGASANEAYTRAIGALYRMTLQQSLILTYADLFRISATLFLFCYVPLMFLRKKKPSGNEPEEAVMLH